MGYLRSITKSIALAAALIPAAVTTGCDKVDDDRIPPYPVYVQFQTQADWIVYGVAGACDYKYFIKDTRTPANFPWTALTETGFGGILLVSDIHGNPQAFDLACPVEAQRSVRVTVDTDLQKARCPRCHSVYDIFTNYGLPVEGEAAQKGYALRHYHTGAGYQGQYLIITN
ncbi:MAG: hypothetical protein HDS69_03440 [Bacteroidales bacterium]|nr:hypothetical protein [Bacteroidales bacterium]MBD5229078.1 hypothetical protein [Bacteroidales bacterium]